MRQYKLTAVALSLLCIMQMPVCAETAPAQEITAPLFEASFLQSWYCFDWTPEQWQTELSDMKAAGFRSVILQSTLDISILQIETNDPVPGSGTQRIVRALYPTELFSGDKSSAIEYALSAAESVGMQVYLGTVSDERWWDYGWDAPIPEFQNWSTENTELNAAVIGELWSMYGERYGKQIAGFYYNNEIWNIPSACKGGDDGAYAKTIGESIRACVDNIEACCPEKPLMISPFYNTSLSEAGAYADFLAAIVSEAQLRPQDIIAPQDGGGREYDCGTITVWNSSLMYAVQDTVQFWVNNETFDTNRNAVGMDTLRQHYLATDFARKHILFSWNHYYHGKYDAEFAKLCKSMTGDVNADGVCSLADAAAMVHWLMHDRIAIANWRAGDLDANGKWNAADLTLLKRLLLSA